MVECSRCSGLSSATLDSGTLLLAPLMSLTFRTLRLLAGRLAIPFTEPAPQVLAIALVPGRIEQLCDSWARELGPLELRDTRTLWLEHGAAMTLAHLRDTLSLSGLIARVHQGWLTPMILDGRLTTHFQPIVRVDTPHEVYAFECLLRGKTETGATVAPGTLFDAARDSDLLFELDRAARLASIREAVAHGLESRLFINFNPTAIYDPVFCLRSTVAAIEDAGIDPHRVVFEVVESDQFAIDLIEIVASYRRAGFRVALDDLGAGYGSLNLLAKLQPDFVKLDMKLIHQVDRDPFKAGITSTLLAMARRLGITTVAEGVETVGEWNWIRDHGADLAQGYFVARPASPPPDPFARAGWSQDHAAAPGPAAV